MSDCDDIMEGFQALVGLEEAYDDRVAVIVKSAVITIQIPRQTKENKENKDPHKIKVRKRAREREREAACLQAASPEVTYKQLLKT